VSAAGDEPRFLARGLGYVSSSAIAMDKLEAIDSEEQRRQTLASRRCEEQRERAAWVAARGQIVSAADDFGRVASPRFTGHLRALRRATQRIDDELRASADPGQRRPQAR
jgi:hypothetical protein